MNKYNLNIEKVTDTMISATEYNVYWWAFLHMSDTLKLFETSLRDADANKDSDDIKGWYRYNIVECKKVLVEIYEKLITFKECQNGIIQKPDWMDEFLKIDTTTD